MAFFYYFYLILLITYSTYLCYSSSWGDFLRSDVFLLLDVIFCFLIQQLLSPYPRLSRCSKRTIFMWSSSLHVVQTGLGNGDQFDEA